MAWVSDVSTSVSMVTSSEVNMKMTFVGWFDACCLALLILVAGGKMIEPLEPPNNLISRHLDSDFTLTCNPPALTPAPNIVWYFNNIPLCLQPDDRDCYIQPGLSSDNGSLLFSAASLDHAGWYTCATASPMLGRRETDFLVIIQEPPRLGFNFTQSYVVLEDSRLELPCPAVSGQPHPATTWLMPPGMDVLQSCSSCKIDENTGSLVTPDVQSLLVNSSTFRCSVSNEVDSVSSTDIKVTVNRNDGDLPFSSEYGGMIGNQSALYFQQDQLLNCTNLSTAALQGLNFTVNWTKNSEPRSTDNQLMTDSSGFYCCEIMATEMLMDPLLAVCATVVILNAASFAPPPEVVSLPAGRNATLLCQGPLLENIYAPLTFSWVDENGPLDPTEGETRGLELPAVMKGQTYLRTQVERAGVVNYSCVVKRTVDSAGLQLNYTSITTLTTVDICTSDNNVLRGSGADFVNMEEFNKVWISSGEKASLKVVNSEAVFAVEGNGTLQQFISVPPATSFLISGRLRQNASNGTAVIRVLSSGSQLVAMRNPDRVSVAWQWVSHRYTFDSTEGTPSTLTILLELREGGEGERAYFDDLCISFEPEPALLLVVAISAAAAGLILILLGVIILCRFCLCKTCDGYLSRKKGKRSNTIHMSKVTDTLLRKWKKPKKKNKTARLEELLSTVDNSSSPIANSAITKGIASWQSPTASSPPNSALPNSEARHKDDSSSDSISDDEYVNSQSMTGGNHLANTTSIPMVNLMKTLPEESKRVIDFGDDDFAFVDPKIIVTKAKHMITRSQSANNLKVSIQPSVKMTGQNLIVQSTLPHSRSTGNLNTVSVNSDATGGTEYVDYNYVAMEVDWALAKRHTPGGARLDSSDEDSVNEPLYENKLQTGESDYENEVRVASRETYYY